MRIEHWTDEQIKELKERLPMSKPTEWAVMDGPIVYGFYETGGKAQAAILYAEFEESVSDAFDDWLNEQALLHGVERTVIEKIVRG